MFLHTFPLSHPLPNHTWTVCWRFSEFLLNVDMHECRLSLCVVLLILLEVCICKQQYALNVPRVLLPLVASGVRSNFTITATQGCFTWYDNVKYAFLVLYFPHAPLMLCWINLPAILLPEMFH